MTRIVPREAIDKLKEKEEQKWENLNEKIVPDKVWPAYFTAMKDVERIVLQIGRKCDPSERKLVGDDMLETAGVLVREYVKMANGWEGLKPMKYKAFALESIHHIRTSLMILVNEHTIDYDTVRRLEHKLEVLEGKALNVKI